MSKARTGKFYFRLPYSFVLHDPDFTSLRPAAQAAYVRILAYMASLYPEATNGQTIINETTLKFLTGRTRIDKAEGLMREIEAAKLALCTDYGGLNRQSGDKKDTVSRLRTKDEPRKWLLAVENPNDIKGPRVQKSASYLNSSLNQLSSKKDLKGDVEEEEKEAKKDEEPLNPYLPPPRDPATCDEYDPKTEPEPYSAKRAKASRGGNGAGPQKVSAKDLPF